MSVTFFVQNNLVEKLTRPVAEFAQKNGYALIDRSSTKDFNPDDCGIDWSQEGCILPYGSVQFIQKLKRSRSLEHTVLYSQAGFSAERWKSVFGQKLLNWDGFTASAAELPALIQHRPHHIRPLQDDKAFNAKVFDLASWNSNCEERDLSGELLCWASPVKQIEAEWRCWGVGSELVEVSQYRENGQMKVARGCPPEVLEFAQEVQSTWLPEPCVVFDVAKTDEGLRLIEFNPVHCSGWYGADSGRVLAALAAWYGKSFS